jgi:hypothetical protein
VAASGGTHTSIKKFSVLNTLNYCDGPILVILNAVIDNPRRGRTRRYSTEKLVDVIHSDTWCRSRIEGHGWREASHAMEYDGTGKTSTKMSTTAYYLPYRKALLAG